MLTRSLVARYPLTRMRQLAGVRFMWSNLIDSLAVMRDGSRGFGCILVGVVSLGSASLVWPQPPARP